MPFSSQMLVIRSRGLTVKIELEPIAYVETVRTKVEDDYWGGEESCITLSDRFAPDALLGIEDFSHAEVIFFLDRIESSKVK